MTFIWMMCCISVRLFFVRSPFCSLFSFNYRSFCIIFHFAYENINRRYFLTLSLKHSVHDEFVSFVLPLIILRPLPPCPPPIILARWSCISFIYFPITHTGYPFVPSKTMQKFDDEGLNLFTFFFFFFFLAFSQTK